MVDLDTLVATALGGTLAIGGGMASVLLGRWQERRHRYREHQIQLVGEAMAAAQQIMRIITTIAYGDPNPYDRLSTATGTARGEGRLFPGGDGTDDFYESMTMWNSALHRLFLSAPTPVIEKSREIDLELDRLLDIAHDVRWSREGFRNERARVGRLLLEFVQMARQHVGFEPVEVTGSSIWTWGVTERPEDAA